MGALVDLTGRVFGKLTVFSRGRNKRGTTLWWCRCECGREREVQAGNLVSGSTRACGCLSSRYPFGLTKEERKNKQKERDKKKALKEIGWTVEQYEEAKVLQGNLCAVCKEYMGIAFADHEHVEPPKKRELLCMHCNIGLGHFKDNVDKLAKAIAYLRKHNAKT